MKALILKDLLVLRKVSKVYLVLFVVYFILSFYLWDESGAGNFAIGFITIMCAMLPITALSYDERSHWDKYALTMPVSRRDMVVSKYLLGLTLIIGIDLLLFLASALAGHFRGGFDVAAQVQEILLFACAGVLFLSVNLPAMIKLGVERGRIVLIALVIFLVCVPFTFLQNKNLTSVAGVDGAGLLPTNILLALLGITVLVMLASMKLSIGLYKKKSLS